MIQSLCNLSLALVLMSSATSALAVAATPAAADARYAPEPYVQLSHPAWSRNAVLYQLNTRQFSAEGTFDYQDVFQHTDLHLRAGAKLAIEPWGYRVLERIKATPLRSAQTR